MVEPSVICVQTGQKEDDLNKMLLNARKSAAGNSYRIQISDIRNNEAVNLLNIFIEKEDALKLADSILKEYGY
jgi:hypothetical protein